MAAEEGLRNKARRSRWLPLLLGLAIVACSLAFGWVALAPATRPGEPAATRVAASTWPPLAKRAGSAARPASGSAVERVALTVMTLGNELTREQIAEFEVLNPDIRIVFFEYSTNLLDILLASGDLPDVFRSTPLEYQSLAKRGLLLDITDRVAGSKLIAPADLRPEFSAQASVDGRYYGLPQGLDTPDFASLYINKAAFREAGIPIPSLRQPLTYAELAEVANRLAARTGRPAFYSFFFERAVTAALVQRGSRMFSEDFNQMRLNGNTEALAVLRYFYDLCLSGAMYVAPATPSIAFLFENGELPISQSAYWMGAVVTPALPAYGQVTMLPAPVWDRRTPRVGFYLGGPRLAISAASTQPDQAYRFIEWYATGTPAVERARRGWGFPMLRSMEALLPQSTEFDRQRLQVAMDDLSLPDAQMPEYPYPGIVPAFNQSWTHNMALAKSGRINFEEFASNLQEDVNLAIRDEVSARHAQAQR